MHRTRSALDPRRIESIDDHHTGPKRDLRPRPTEVIVYKVPQIVPKTSTIEPGRHYSL